MGNRTELDTLEAPLSLAKEATVENPSLNQANLCFIQHEIWWL